MLLLIPGYRQPQEELELEQLEEHPHEELQSHDHSLIEESTEDSFITSTTVSVVVDVNGI